MLPHLPSHSALPPSNTPFRCLASNPLHITAAVSLSVSHHRMRLFFSQTHKGALCLATKDVLTQLSLCGHHPPLHPHPLQVILKFKAPEGVTADETDAADGMQQHK